jgi:flavin reductase (DIM6/NTAB) family NADH-FMN oxidoreductase RutF
MDKVKGMDIGEFYRHSPMPVAVITAHAHGRDGGMSAAWISPISFSPPLFGVSIAAKRHTFSMVVESGEFAVNFFALEDAEIFAQFGSCSGRDTDKFKKFGVRGERGEIVSAPIIESAYAAYECKLFAQKTFGDHDWFVGEIVCIHRRRGVITADGGLDLNVLAPSLYLGQEQYASLHADGVRFLDRKKHAGV